MMTTSTSARRSAGLAPVLLGGLVAGTLDILFAITFWGLKASVPATRILQSVASGLLGKASFEGGTATAVLGLGLHFLIATTMSLAYYVVARRWRLLVERAIPLGAAYGLFLYGMMNYVVVPLSRANSGGAKNPLWVGLGIAVHMFLIGVPIALASRRAITSR